MRYKLYNYILSEQGKPLREAIGEMIYAANFIEYFAKEAKRVYGDIIPSPYPDRRLFVLKQPVGVVAAITPWNYPLAMITRKAGLALACGCTMVIKPSELTPLTALAAVELAIQSGIPPGVLNTVMGDALSIGKALLESPQVMKITFTGSTAVGKKLMAGAAETVKKNSPLYLQQLIIMKISNCSGFQMLAKGSVRHNHLLDAPHSFKYLLPALNTEDPADLSETIPPATTGQKEKKDV